MSFIRRLFGKGKSGDKGLENLVENLLDGIFERGGFDLSADVDVEVEGSEFQTVKVEIFGDDDELLTERDGALLDSFQLFLKRAVQHNYPDQSPEVLVDCRGFREEADRTLIELVEKLRDKALEQGRSVYLRQLAPKDRKTVHQFLAEDGRVKSRSVGEGLFKKIKIYPARKNNTVKEAQYSQDQQ